MATLNSKQDVLHAVREFALSHGIPLDKITVGGGAALVLMGLRQSTQDLNLWIDNPHYNNLAEDHKVLVHPLRDTVVTLPKSACYVRARNSWFGHDTVEGVQIFDVLALIINYRGGYSEHRRPADKRFKDRDALVGLAAIHAERNKVSA